MEYIPKTDGLSETLKKNLLDIARVMREKGGGKSVARNAPLAGPISLGPPCLKIETAGKLKLFSGFVDSNQGVTYDPTSRTWTITGTGSTEICWDGVLSKIDLPWTSPPHSTTTDVFHFLYSSDGVNFITSLLHWEYWYIQVAGAFYDSNPLYRFGVKETHGATQSHEDHRQNHQARGTYRVSGGTLTAGSYLLEPSSPTNAGNRPLFDATTISDEDLQVTNAASTTESYTRYWASANGSKNWALASANIVGIGTTYPLWDNEGTQTELATNKLMWVYRIEIPTTDDAQSQQFRTVMISGSEVFSTKAEALLGSIKYRIGNLLTIAPEFVCVRRILIETRASYSTVGKFRIVAEQLVEGSRISSVQASSGAVTSVNGLNGAVVLTQDEVPNGVTYGRLTNTQVTDLTDAGDSTLHYHASDRNRANHTGTQLASTISDFAATVRGVVLTGLSLASSAVISASDTILSALGKLQAQITLRALDNNVIHRTGSLAESANGVKTFTDGVVLGSASNGFNIGSVGSDTYGIWRTAVASPSLANYAFALTSEGSFLHGPLRAGLLVANSYKVKATSSGVELFTDATAGNNRVFLRKYSTTNLPVFYMGVAEGGESTTNHTLLGGSTATELNHASVAGLTVAGTWRVKCQTNLIQLYPSDGDIALTLTNTEVSTPKNVTTTSGVTASYFRNSGSGHSSASYTTIVNGNAIELFAGRSTNLVFNFAASNTAYTVSLISTTMNIGDSCLLSVKTTGSDLIVNSALLLQFNSIEGVPNPARTISISRVGRTVDFIVYRNGNGFKIIGNYYT